MNSQPGVDIIGDCHGTYEELVELLAKLGHTSPSASGSRRLIFVGDFADRGPRSADVLKLVMHLVQERGHFAVIGNHDQKLLRALKGNPVRIGHGLGETLRQLNALPQAIQEKALIESFLEGLPYQIRFSLPGHPDLYVTHAGIDKSEVGRTDKKILAYCIYGHTDGKTAAGFPNRTNHFRSSWPDFDIGPYQVHGHSVTDNPRPDTNRVYNIDGGCVFGGQLNALRFPELEIVSVKALKVYHERESSDVAEEATT